MKSLSLKGLSAFVLFLSTTACFASESFKEEVVELELNHRNSSTLEIINNNYIRENLENITVSSFTDATLQDKHLENYLTKVKSLQDAVKSKINYFNELGDLYSTIANYTSGQDRLFSLMNAAKFYIEAAPLYEDSNTVDIPKALGSVLSKILEQQENSSINKRQIKQATQELYQLSEERENR